MNKDCQMELGFNGARPRLERQKKQTRSQWWFHQMREVVDRAFDWHNAPPPRAAQEFIQFGR